MGPFSGSPRAAMDRYSAAVLGILHDNINELRAAGERAKALGKPAQFAMIGDILGRLGLRYLELSLGKKLHFNVNIRNQDQLPDFRALPPEVQERLNVALDAVEAFERGRVIPAKALASRRLDSGEGRVT